MLPFTTLDSQGAEKTRRRDLSGSASFPMCSLRNTGGAGVSIRTLRRCDRTPSSAYSLPRRRSLGMPEGQGGRKLDCNYNPTSRSGLSLWALEGILDPCESAQICGEVDFVTYH